MDKHTIKVSYTFDVTYAILADSTEEAKEIARRDTGATLRLGRVTTTNDQRVIDWMADLHPITTKIH